MAEMQSAVRTPVIASGGVTSSEDVADLAATELQDSYQAQMQLEFATLGQDTRQGLG